MDWKRFPFFIESNKQAMFVACLFQDGYRRQAEFLRDVIDAYITDDPEFAVWMNKKRFEKGNIQTKRRLIRKEKLINKAKELEDILFSEQDLNNIFDLIEQDSEDF